MKILNVIGGIIGLYRVVPVDESHVRVMFDKKDVFMSREGYKPSYWVVPTVTKIIKLPLTNIRIDVPDIKLNDKNMAKFMCDIICFVNISNPLLAAERTGITFTQTRYEGKQMNVDSLNNDFRAIMESIGRTVATKQTILDIYMNRDQLDSAVTSEVNKVFPSWGLSLVDLEIKDLKDIPGSTIIIDIEKKQAAEIQAEARIKIAQENKRAAIAEADATRESEVKKAENEEIWKKRNIEKEQKIAIAAQEKLKMESQKTQEANETYVEAQRIKEVGLANISKEVTIKNAEAIKSKTITEAEGVSNQIEITGRAEAEIIKLKKIADAEGTEKLALAQQKFNDAAMKIELIKANKDVKLAEAKAYEEGLKVAKINIVSGETREITSDGLIGKIRTGAKEGAAIQQLLAGLDTESITKLSALLSKGDKK